MFPLRCEGCLHCKAWTAVVFFRMLRERVQAWWAKGGAVEESPGGCIWWCRGCCSLRAHWEALPCKNSVPWSRQLQKHRKIMFWREQIEVEALRKNICALRNRQYFHFVLF